MPLGICDVHVRRREEISLSVSVPRVTVWRSRQQSRLMPMGMVITANSSIAPPMTRDGREEGNLRLSSFSQSVSVSLDIHPRQATEMELRVAPRARFCTHYQERRCSMAVAQISILRPSKIVNPALSPVSIFATVHYAIKPNASSHFSLRLCH